MIPADFVDAERILHTFLELVQIDSPSGQEAEIGAYLKGRLQALSCSVELDEVGNIVARFSGSGNEVVMLSSHMDTVGSDTGIKPVIREGIIYSEGETILGADDKSGVAVILETLAVLNQNPELQHPPIEVVISVREELGLQGAKQLDTSRLQAQWGIVLDAGGPIGTLIYTAPSQNYITAVVKGKKAHAGGSPEKGINAIRVAAEAISAMPLGRIDEETTSNIGVIRGGEATNIVPDEVYMRGEARSRNEAKLQAQTSSMVAALESAAERHGATVDIEVEQAYQTYCISAEQRPYAVAAQAIQSLGFVLIPKTSGGGTDGNIYTAAGIPCVALSTGMAEVHTANEYVAVQDVIDSARVLVTLVVGCI